MGFTSVKKHLLFLNSKVIYFVEKVFEDVERAKKIYPYGHVLHRTFCTVHIKDDAIHFVRDGKKYASLSFDKQIFTVHVDVAPYWDASFTNALSYLTTSYVGTHATQNAAGIYKRRFTFYRNRQTYSVTAAESFEIKLEKDTTNLLLTPSDPEIIIKKDNAKYRAFNKQLATFFSVVRAQERLNAFHASRSCFTCEVSSKMPVWRHDHYILSQFLKQAFSAADMSIDVEKWHLESRCADMVADRVVEHIKEGSPSSMTGPLAFAALVSCRFREPNLHCVNHTINRLYRSIQLKYLRSDCITMVKSPQQSFDYEHATR